MANGVYIGFLRWPSVNQNTSWTGQKGLSPKVNILILLSFLLLLSGSSSAASIKSLCRKVGGPMIVDEQGCDMVVVNVNKCSGFCPSFSFKNPLQQNQLYLHGRCCRMIDVEMLSVKLTCGNNEVREVKIASATQCGCFDCL